ncbi:hypothetical protein P153DRAFT_432841 [Dothidotthia symphoricarpi CBS 119687]|uniref:Uncharacterized protein n=1 Tax=Dothidotthia symphoricarpi CBS 119687 TaxID=1392245 RepID=A0A6A6A9K2_9PLEO|nr:uncharacterized protein P153DRAFT_432841 [Dothidotthia symphoricarpi CBS 119687]KAF2127784.1 hypothetical protein P153DRAFT_432841 [Dothidotthia symphoricarpi CBS 119687]
MASPKELDGHFQAPATSREKDIRKVFKFLKDGHEDGKPFGKLVSAVEWFVPTSPSSDSWLFSDDERHRLRAEIIINLIDALEARLVQRREVDASYPSDVRRFLKATEGKNLIVDVIESVLMGSKKAITTNPEGATDTNPMPVATEAREKVVAVENESFRGLDLIVEGKGDDLAGISGGSPSANSRYVMTGGAGTSSKSVRTNLTSNDNHSGPLPTDSTPSQFVDTVLTETVDAMPTVPGSNVLRTSADAGPMVSNLTWGGQNISPTTAIYYHVFPGNTSLPLMDNQHDPTVVVAQGLLCPCGRHYHNVPIVIPTCGSDLQSLGSIIQPTLHDRRDSGGQLLGSRGWSNRRMVLSSVVPPLVMMLCYHLLR